MLKWYTWVQTFGGLYLQLGLAIFEELYFHDLFEMNKTKIQFIQANKPAYMVKLISSSIEANFVSVIFKSLKI